MSLAAGAALSDLTRAREESGEVVAVEDLSGGLIELTARLPHLAAEAHAGEFAQLRCSPGPAPLLRRPMSVAWVDGDTCSFVFERVGVGTRLLAAMRAGDRLDVLGPLGVGFTTSPTLRRVLCVAGGLGCAPFPLLARQLRQQGTAEVIVCHGAATAERLYPDERFVRGDSTGVHVAVVTDDGSRGHRGLVVDIVEPAIRDGVDAVFACGPNAMLAATAAMLADVDTGARVPVMQVSLEAPMGCGFGTCLGCALPVRSEETARWALCCREGPVMDAAAVEWEALMQLPPADVA